MSSWSNIEGCYYNANEINGITDALNSKIVAFDFDDTLVSRKTKEILPNVKEVLNEWHKKGCQVVVFSNQMGITKNKTTHEEVQQHFENFMKIVDIPIIFYYSIRNDKYRKPSNGMFYVAIKRAIKHDCLFYCGDACGRDKDFSSSDLYFAHNCNILFKTPEEVFHNNVEAIVMRDTPKLVLYKDDIWVDGKLSNPRELFDLDYIQPDPGIIDELVPELLELPELPSSVPELDVYHKLLIYMIGPMASGKSTLSKILSVKYNLEIVNLDDSSAKKVIKSNIKIGYEQRCGVIIDNCNPTIKNREYWLKLVKENIDETIKLNIYYIHFNIPKPISIHLTRYRTFCNYQEDKYEYDTHEYNKFNKNIPVVAIHKYYKSLEIPKEGEEGTLITLTKAITLIANDHNFRFVWN